MELVEIGKSTTATANRDDSFILKKNLLSKNSEMSIRATEPSLSMKPSSPNNASAGGGHHGVHHGDVKQYTLKGISPHAFLALFTIINMFIYGDRGIFAVG